MAGQIARMQREPCGSRPEKGKGSNAPPNSKDGSATGRKKTRPGGKPGRRKDRSGSVNEAGLRYGPEAVVIDIDVMPPEVEGLSADEYEIISERVCCKLATVPVRHAVIRYHYRKVRLKRTGVLISPPAREGVFGNSCIDVSFVADMLVDRLARHLPPCRQHQRLAESGITISRRAMSDWANRAITLLEPTCEAQLRSVPGAMSSSWTRRRCGPDANPAVRAG